MLKKKQEKQFKHLIDAKYATDRAKAALEKATKEAQEADEAKAALENAKRAANEVERIMKQLRALQNSKVQYTKVNEPIDPLVVNYAKLFLRTINVCAKFNKTNIMTPEIMTFFKQNGFEISPMGYDLLKVNKNQIVANEDLSIILSAAGYKSKFVNGVSIYSRF